ncbi:MAG: dockerin type I repeat-containing protein [Bacteroidales bacterium]
MKKSVTLLLLAVLPAFLFAQWSNNPYENTAISIDPGEQSLPKTVMHPSGITYVSWYSIENGNYNVRLQKFDIYGVKQWAEEGLLVSDHQSMTWLTDWDLAVDNDACAIITFQDIRNGDNNIYAYRISPDGTFLWGPDGIALSNNPDFEASPVVTVTSLNNYVFAWTRDNTIMVQKLNSEGIKQWGEYGIQLQGTETFTWPFIVPSDDDGIIMSFFKQTGPIWAPVKNVYAQRFSADGQLMWGDGIAISNNAGIPTYVKTKIISDKNGGAFIVWHRDNGSYFDSYVQHVNGAGTLGFPANGLAVSLSSGTHQIDPVIAYNHNTEELFVAWREQSFNQSNRGISAQKISLNGTRLWGDMGVVVEPMQLGEKSGLNIVVDGNETIISHIDSPPGDNYIVNASKLSNSGELVWEGGHVPVSLIPSLKMHNDATEFFNGQFVVVWADHRNGNYDVYAQNIKSDGTLGPVLTIIPGDANCDGVVDILDVIAIAGYITGSNPQPFCPENADVNNDGIIDLLDVIVVVNLILRQ